MKILIINTVPFEYNGITSVILNYFGKMEPQKEQIDMIAINKIEESVRKKLSGANIYMLPERKRKVFRYRSELKRIIKNGNYDVVHVHGNSATMSLELSIAKRYKVPVRIAHCHNTKCTHKWMHKVMSSYFKKTYTHAIACSKAAGEWIFPRGKYQVLPNGIEVEKYRFNQSVREKVRKELSLGEKLVVGHIGLMNYQKNHEKLLGIVYEMRKIDERVHLLCITGSDEVPENIRIKIQEYGLEDNITILKKRNDVNLLLQGMDVFVFPSRFEGLGIVLIEAQASGLGCVVSDEIPKEVGVIGNIQFLPLSKDSKEWAMESMEMIRKVDRTGLEKYKKIYDSYFNINNDIQLLMNIYG